MIRRLADAVYAWTGRWINQHLQPRVGMVLVPASEFTDMDDWFGTGGWDPGTDVPPQAMACLTPDSELLPDEADS